MKLNELTYAKTGTILNTKTNNPLRNWEQLKELLGYKSIDTMIKKLNGQIKLVKLTHTKRTEYLLVAEQSLAGNKNRSDLQMYAFDGTTEVRTRDKVDFDNNAKYLFHKYLPEINESLDYNYGYITDDYQIIDPETGEVVMNETELFQFINNNKFENRLTTELIFELSPNKEARYKDGPRTEELKSLILAGRGGSTRTYVYEIINTLDLLDNYTPTNEEIFIIAEGRKITKQDLELIKSELQKIQLDTDSSNLSHQTKTIKPMEGTQMITNITITKGSTINLNGFTVTRINNIRYEIAGIEGKLSKSEMLAIVNQPTELTPVIEPTKVTEPTPVIQTTETINVPEVINEVPVITESDIIDVPEQPEPDEFIFDSIKAIYTLSEMKQLIKSDKINLLQFMINYKRRVTTQTYEFFMDRQHR
ncbi:MAG: hypothetical protein ACRCX2_22175, partial [Paraclostridium sp.]